MPATAQPITAYQAVVGEDQIIKLPDDVPVGALVMVTVVSSPGVQTVAEDKVIREEPAAYSTAERKILGRYIVADPRICHGKLTFRGTRIFVEDILEQVAEELPWERIVESWGGSISEEAIAEAVDLSRRAFLDHYQDYVIESVPA